MINKINLENYLNKKIMIALSGGPDSIFLLWNCLKKFKSENLIACHVNYNFRSDSNYDMEICKKICKKYNVRLKILNLKKDYKNLKDNFEGWARNIRYDFFKKIIIQENFDVIFTGHNLNDFVETYLIQVARKTNTNYFGINKTTFINNVEVHRPLLNCLKSYIYKELDILISKNLIFGYAIDSTNLDTKYLRNKIRLKLNEEQIINFKDLIESKNLELIKNLKIVNNFNYQNNFLYLPDLRKYKKEIRLKIIYKFLSNSDYKNNFISSKKNRINEFLKISDSPKSLITNVFGDCFVIKDREYIYLDNVFFSNNYEFENLNNKNAKKFDNYEILYKFNKKNIGYVFSNNWRKYKDFLIEKSKIKLVDIYKKQKTPYLIRFKNLLIIDIKKKQLRVSYLKNLERE